MAAEEFHSGLDWCKLISLPLIKKSDVLTDNDRCFFCEDKGRDVVWDPFCTANCLRLFYEGRLSKETMDALVADLTKRGELEKLVKDVETMATLPLPKSEDIPIAAATQI